MAHYAKSQGLRHRAHAKTHKSPDIALHQIANGAVGVCCQKVSEAEAMVDGGVRDVMVSNQVINPHMIDRLTALARQARVLVCVDDLDNIAQINAAALRHAVSIKALALLSFVPAAAHLPLRVRGERDIREIVPAPVEVGPANRPFPVHQGQGAPFHYPRVQPLPEGLPFQFDMGPVAKPVTLQEGQQVGRVLRHHVPQAETVQGDGDLAGDFGDTHAGPVDVDQHDDRRAIVAEAADVHETCALVRRTADTAVIEDELALAGRWDIPGMIGHRILGSQLRQGVNMPSLVQHRVSIPVRCDRVCERTSPCRCALRQRTSPVLTSSG
ncbi:hypothetical protein HC341_04380 [Aquisalimonas sp. 2447]|nr:hypothetical protein HC341_04380 [Aquisalimonas sp. 2447]